MTRDLVCTCIYGVLSHSYNNVHVHWKNYFVSEQGCNYGAADIPSLRHHAGAVGCILYYLMLLLVRHHNIFMLPSASPCHRSLKGFVWKIKWLKFEGNYMLFSGRKKVRGSHCDKQWQQQQQEKMLDGQNIGAICWIF